MDEEQNICKETLKQCLISSMSISLQDADVFLNEIPADCETIEEKIGYSILLFDLYMFSLRTKKGCVFDFIINWIDEYYSKEEYAQLESNEVFETFLALDIKNAKKLFLRMGCKTTIVDGLCKSLRENDPKGFIREIDKCDIRIITPYLDYFHNQIELFKMLQGDDKSDEEEEEKAEQYVINWKVKSEKAGDKIMLNEVQLSNFNDDSFTEEQKSAAFSYLYCYYWFKTAILENSRILTKKEEKVVHYILDIPGCVDLQNRCKDLWNDNISDDEFLKSFECVPKIREHYVGLLISSSKDVEVQSGKSIKDVAEEVRRAPSSTRGRKRATWFKPHPDITEEEFSKGIERDIWPKLKKRLDGFKFADKCNSGIAREKVVKVLGASLIYYAAEKAGIAYPFDRNSSKNKSVGSMSSFERTMAFLKTKDGTGLSRTSMKPYMEMFDQYERGLQFITQGNSLFDFLNRYMKHDGIRATILAHNIKSFSGILKELDSKLTTIYNKPLEL